MTENENNKIINLVVNCPHCNDPILIEQLNCCIFRHGSFKSDGTQIGPHSSKQECDHYITNNLIFGCGKPFRIIKNESNNEYYTIICDYI